MSYVGREIVRRGNCPGGICARGMSYTQMRRHIVSPSRPIRFLLSSRYQMTLRHFCHLCFSLSPVVSDLNATVFKCLTCTARSVSNARFTRCVSLKSINCVIVSELLSRALFSVSLCISMFRKLAGRLCVYARQNWQAEALCSQAVRPSVRPFVCCLTREHDSLKTKNRF